MFAGGGSIQATEIKPGLGRDAVPVAPLHGRTAVP